MIEDLRDSFSYWMRHNLKDAFSGLITQDIDLVVLLKNKQKFFFIEEKNSLKARLGPAQKVIFKMFDDFLSFEELSWKFLGTAVVIITNKEVEGQAEDYIKQKIIGKVVRALKNRDFNLEKDILDKLWDCKPPPKIQKTERERSGYRGSIIKNYLNLFHNNTLCIQTVDWIFVNYCSGYFILIEELNKVNKREKVSNKHRQTFIKILDEIFTMADKLNRKYKTARNPKSGALYRYLGFYRIEFDNTHPDNSTLIKINNNPVDSNCLCQFLNLDTHEILSYRGQHGE